MNVALLTDSHYGFKKGNKIFHDYFEKFYKETFFPYLIENQIETVIHLGDSFDNRKGIDYWSLKWAKENIYDKFKSLGITVYNIIGNHDIYYKNTNKLNSVEYLLSEYNNIIKVSSIKEFKIDGTGILMIPWINDENAEDARRTIENTSCDIAMGHLELNGFRVNPQLVMDHGMDPKIFNKFKKVFSGHYHTRSNDGKIFYIGNPYQMFWSDLNDSRGFAVFNTETLDHKYINNPNHIFKIIHYDEDELNNNFEEYENCIVKIIIKNKKNQKLYEKYIDKLIKSNPHEFKVIENIQIQKNIEDEKYIESEDTLSLLKKYVDESEISLNKNIIKKMIHNIYQESYQL